MVCLSYCVHSGQQSVYVAIHNMSSLFCDDLTCNLYKYNTELSMRSHNAYLFNLREMQLMEVTHRGAIVRHLEANKVGVFSKGNYLFLYLFLAASNFLVLCLEFFNALMKALYLLVHLTLSCLQLHDLLLILIYPPFRVSQLQLKTKAHTRANVVNTIANSQWS